MMNPPLTVRTNPLPTVPTPRGQGCDAIYGDTGSTKTSRLGDAAEYFYEKTGKPSHLISTDLGGWEPIQDLVDSGIVVPFRVTSSREFLIEDFNKLSWGWWPVDAADPTSPLDPPRWDEIGSLLFDGGTSMCRMMLSTHEGSIKALGDGIIATDIRVPEMPKDSFIRSGSYLRRFLGRSDYGGVQGRIWEFIRNSAMLPVRSVWTFLESQGTDERRKPVYGPDFAGQALTGVCGPWFGNLIHLDFTEVEKSVPDPNDKNKTIRIVTPVPTMFLRNHIDPADPYKLVYPAKPRAPRKLWQEVPDFMAPDLKKFYHLLDALLERARSSPSTPTTTKVMK